MATRKQTILDAAIRVLGSSGSRGLTHRSVDGEAGLPSGSTSNYLRSRQALISGIVERMEELDYQDWARQSPAPVVESPAEFADVLTVLVSAAVTGDRIRTQARYAVFVEAAMAGADSPIAQSIERSRANLKHWGAGIAAGIGLAESERAAAMLVDYLDGVIFHHLTRETFEPDAVRSDIARFLAGLDTAGTS
ncbi:TetR/AcrR family transcriptional regulator [Arthrobacter pigmenti]